MVLKENLGSKEIKAFFKRIRNIISNFLITLMMLLAITAFFACNNVDVKGQAKKNDNEVDIDSALVSLIETYDIPSIGYAVLDSDSLIDMRIKGLKSCEDKLDSADLKSKYYLASVTKSFTATMIASLVKDGLMSWEDTPADIWPHKIESFHPDFHNITLLQLLSHSAGIKPMTSYEEWKSLPDIKNDSAKSFTYYLLSLKPSVKPGTTFLYSNGGYAVAAQMATAKTGKDWETLVEEHIFHPLKINGSFGRPGNDGTNEIYGHWYRSKNDSLEMFNPEGTYSPNQSTAAAGAISMDIRDLSVYVQQHLKGLLGKETKVLNSKMFKKLHSPIIKIEKDLDSNIDDPRYALGWAIYYQEDSKVHGHSGSDGRFKTKVSIQPSNNIAFVVMMNAGHSGAEEAADSLLSLLNALY